MSDIIAGPSKKVFVTNTISNPVVTTSQGSDNVVSAINSLITPNDIMAIQIANDNNIKYGAAVIGAEDTDSKSAVKRLVWRYTGADEYTFLSTDTQLFCSSSSNLDIGNTIVAVGTDSNYNEVTRTCVLNGYSQVPFSDTLFRVNFVQAVSGVLAGDVYIAETDTETNGVPDTPSKVKDIISNIADFSTFRSVHASSTGVFTIPKVTLSGRSITSAHLTKIDIYPDAPHIIVSETTLPGFPTSLNVTTQSGGSSPYSVNISEGFSINVIPPSVDISIYAQMGSPNQTISVVYSLVYCLA